MNANDVPAFPKKHLHIEDFPSDLKQQMKAAAALAGVTMREWAVKGLTAAVTKAVKAQGKGR
jgi:hypothetical protein